MSDYRAAIIDVDGTLITGDTPIPGASDMIHTLLASGIQPLLFSNNPTRSASQYRQRLAEWFPVEECELLTSGTVTADYLSAEYPDSNIFLVGESGLRAQLADRNLSLVEHPDAASVVVGSIDREFDYQTLTEGLHALQAADQFVVTDPDRTIPTEHHPVPGTGPIVAALERAADRTPDVLAGKPSALARQTALDQLGATAEDCLIIGDRLDTDIAMGGHEDMTTVLVCSGVTDRTAVAKSSYTPTYIIDSIAQLNEVLSIESPE